MGMENLISTSYCSNAGAVHCYSHGQRTREFSICRRRQTSLPRQILLKSRQGRAKAADNPQTAIVILFSIVIVAVSKGSLSKIKHITIDLYPQNPSNVGALIVRIGFWGPFYYRL